MRLTKPTVKVLTIFLEHPAQEQYGFGLMRTTGVKGGSLYPILERLESVGWISAHEEVIDEHAEGRPKRRLYRLTGAGRREATAALADFYRDLLPAASWLRRKVAI
jgi:PadR family transcriptional regulator, regulatory protein PadR